MKYQGNSFFSTMVKFERGSYILVVVGDNGYRYVRDYRLPLDSAKDTHLYALTFKKLRSLLQDVETAMAMSTFKSLST